ncbi:MAG: magnesium protoporphyrin IX methyltransferase [Pseudomonadota bacterium]
MTDFATTYLKRREQLETYFDRTALENWKRLVTDAPVSRVRATVRAGRDEMRAAIVDMFPADLSGWRILDAGCGSGPLSRDLAMRGADVIGVDLSVEMVRFAMDRWANEDVSGSLTFASGDMLSEYLGDFDAVVAMDSIIHYSRADMVNALANILERTSKKVVFTVAPATPMLTVMHRVGQLFPRSNRSPAIVPVKPVDVAMAGIEASDLPAWTVRQQHRVTSGFYISHAVEVVHQ